MHIVKKAKWAKRGVVKGTPLILRGGSLSAGPPSGDFRVEVTDAGLSQSSTGRPALQLELTVKDDPVHLAKNGMKLTRMFQALPMQGDHKDKVQQIRGMVKRLVYDGFGVKWPSRPRALDPRIFVGKEGWVRIRIRPGEDYPRVTAIAPHESQLPPQRAEVKPPKRKAKKRQQVSKSKPILKGKPVPPGEYKARIGDDGRFEVVGKVNAMGKVNAKVEADAAKVMAPFEKAKANAKAQGELLGRKHQIDEVLPELYRIIGEATMQNAVLPYTAIQVRDLARKLCQRSSDLWHQYDSEAD